MSTPQAARLRLAALNQQVDDAEQAEIKAKAAVEAAKAAQEATSVAVSYVYSAVAGTTPVATPVSVADSTIHIVPQSEPASINIERDSDTEQMPSPTYRPEATQRYPTVVTQKSRRTEILAILGAIIAFMITLSTRTWFADLANVEGAADWFFRFGWVGLGTLSGWFLTGWFVANLEERNNDPFKEAYS